MNECRNATNRRWIWGTLVAAGLVGCAQSAGDVYTRLAHYLTVTPTYDAISGETFDVADPVAISEVCPNDRMIGLRDASQVDCPMPGADWKETRLFDGLVSTAELDRYCIYDWVGAGSPNVQTLPGDGGGGNWDDWLSADCNAVGALGHPYGDTNWATLQDAFFEQTERVSLGAGVLSPKQTRVAVLDSAVDKYDVLGNPSSGRMNHGRAVGWAIKHLACPNIPGSNCAASLASTLALKLEATPAGNIRNEAEGGFFGSQGDLANSIVESVVQWQDDAPDRNLIINLSVGWSSSYGGAYTGADPSSLPGPVRAVHAAITYARCHGALVIAAAGNHSGGPSPESGPMYPAAWESKGAPTQTRCDDLDAPQPPSSTTTYTPLVHSASGVDGRDHALTNARPQAQPRLAAPAAHVSVADPTPGSGIAPTDVYTGSSMASAVTSAAAAVAWGYRPALSGDDVMAHVYDSGVALGISADYCHGTSCPTVRRVSVCETVASACASSSPRCPATVPSCSGLPAGRDLRPTGIDVSATIPGEVTVSASALSPTMYGAPCSALVYRDGATPEPCVGRQYHNKVTVPWVEPQPDEPPCTICFLNKDGTLYLGISDSLGAPVTNPTLTTKLTSGATKVFDLSSIVSSVAPGDTIKVEDVVSSSGVLNAQLDFLVGGEYSASDSVLLE